jgi:hypothetical protein
MRLTAAVVTLLAIFMLLVSVVPGRLLANEPRQGDEATVGKLVESKRERRMSRMDLWVRGLEGDKKRIYMKYGHPSGRIREEAMGTVIEKWTYLDPDKTFCFKGDKLIHTW